MRPRERCDKPALHLASLSRSGIGFFSDTDSSSLASNA